MQQLTDGVRKDLKARRARQEEREDRKAQQCHHGGDDHELLEIGKEGRKEYYKRS